MNQSISAKYWNQHKEMCLEILSYEFQGEANVFDYSYGNDASPSVCIQGETYKFHLFLPSNYLGEYATFSLLSLDADEQSTFIKSFATLGETIEYFKYTLNLI